MSFEPYFLVSVSANILDWHSFSLLFFSAGLGGCFASNHDYFVAVFPFNLVVSRCFTSALIGGELCALNRRLEAKLLALGLCILAAHWQHLLDI